MLIPGRLRTVKATSAPSPFASTRSGFSTTVPSGSVTWWSATPGFAGAKRTSTLPIGESANQRPSTSSTADEARPAAHRGRFAGSDTKAYTCAAGA